MGKKNIRNESVDTSRKLSKCITKELQNQPCCESQDTERPEEQIQQLRNKSKFHSRLTVKPDHQNEENKV